MTSTGDDVPGDINILPDELIIDIFKLLPLDGLLACESVCERWRKLSRDAALWRRIVIVYSGKPGHTDVSFNPLEVISSHCEYINCLKIQYIYTYPDIQSILNKCANLISVELIMCRIGKDFEVDAARWRNLKKLSLKNTLLLQNSEDITLQYDQFKDLNYLCLSEFGLNTVNRDSLINCTHLTHIYIEKIKSLSLEFIRNLILSKMDIVETLHFYGGDAVDDECLMLLGSCSQLRDLAIIRCENITDKGLLHLTRLTRVHHLQIWNNTIISEMALLSTLGSPNLVKLQSLSLSRIGNISPLIVDVISEFYKNLKFLAVYQCPRIVNTDYEKQLKSKFRNIEIVLW